MRKFAATIVALLVFAGLLVWVLTNERGRVPEKEELLAKQVTHEGGIVGIEAIKYDTVAALKSKEKDEKDDEETAASADATNTAKADADKADANNDAKSADKQEKKTEAKKEEDPTKRIEERRFDVVKRDDEWHFTKPFTGLADPDRMKTMVEAIERLKPSVREDADPSKKEFGLDNPTLKVIATLEKGDKIEITLGDRTPVGAKIYAKVSGLQGLSLIPSTFTTDFQTEPEKLRDKKLARFDKKDVTNVTFVNEHGTFTAEKAEKGKEVNWTITSPGPYKGDEWAITSAFGKLSEVEAKEFVPVPKSLAKYGLDKPRARCIVNMKDGKSYEVLVGKSVTKDVKTSDYSDTTEKKELVYTMRKGRDEVLLVETSLFDDLNKDLMALRDNRILDFKRDRVTKVRVDRREGYKFTVTRAGDEWKLEVPEVGDAQKTKVEDILWDLSDLEAKEYLGTAGDLKKMGLAVPSTVITLELTGKKTIKVKLGDKVGEGADEGYYCMVDDDKQVYRVSPLIVKDLPKATQDIKLTPDTLKKDKPVKLDADSLGTTPSDAQPDKEAPGTSQ